MQSSPNPTTQSQPPLNLDSDTKSDLKEDQAITSNLTSIEESQAYSKLREVAREHNMSSSSDNQVDLSSSPEDRKVPGSLGNEPIPLLKPLQERIQNSKGLQVRSFKPE